MVETHVWKLTFLEGTFDIWVMFRNDKMRHAYETCCRTSIRRGSFINFENSSAMDVLQGPKYVSKCSTNTAISTAAFTWNFSLSGKMTNKYIETYISNDLFSLRLFFTLLDPNLPSIQFLSLQLNFYILSLDFRCCINTFYNAYISAVCKLTKKNEK